MNLRVTIPKRWNPHKRNAFNVWIEKVYKEVKKSKFNQ